jgi:hypothetical protein
MAIDYKIENNPEYLSMIYEGDYDSSLAGLFTDQILETCKTYQPTKLLIDLRAVKGDMTMLDRFNLGVMATAKYFSGKLTGKIPYCRYAIIGNAPLIDPDRFAETVAVNRGLNVRVFTDWKETIDWLESK